MGALAVVRRVEFPPPVLLLPVVWQISLAFIPYTLPSTQKIALQGDFSCTIQNNSLPLQPQINIHLQI